MKRTLLLLTLSFWGWAGLHAQNLEIETVSPAQNENNVSRDSDIVITFSETAAGATVNSSTIQIRGEQTGLLTGAFTGGGTDEITFNPANDFKAGEVIRVTVTTGVEDATDGDTLAAPFSYSFTAAVDPAPETPPFFDTPIVSTNADVARSVYPADLNGDGHMDILSASQIDDKIAWYENDGEGNFTEHSVSDSADGAWNVYAAEVDSDGDMDILSASSIDNKIAWYENDGEQNFTEHLVSTNTNSLFSVYAADVNGDGHMDILSASSIDHKIAWYENDGEQNFTERVVSNSANGAKSVYAADVNGDGHMDILSASLFDDKIAWYENDGEQNFTERVVSTNADQAKSVYVADVNGDGHMDILSASLFDGKIAWYENDGNQIFTEHIVSTNANGAQSVYAADVNGDGNMDILSASEFDDKIAWYENDGEQNFTERVVSTNADGAHSVYATDVNGDGFLDILSASLNDDKIAWYENTLLPDSDPAGRSVSFSTSNNYIEIPHDDLFDLPGAFTLETWIRVDEFDTDWQAILTKGENSWRIHRHSDSNTLAFGTQNLEAGGLPDIQGSTNVNDGQWHHVAAVYNGTDEKRLYIDGMLDVSAAVTGSLSSTSDPVWIANNFGNNGRGWKGNIDEVRIWNTARTEEEIRQNIFQSLNGDEDDLVGYWKLDEEEGTIALDKTGNENHGFFTNGPVRSDETHPYGTFITGGEGWRMMTAPVSGVSFGTLLDTLWTQGFTGADSPSNGAPNVYRWNEGDGAQDTTARGWQPLTDASVVPDPGEAFIVYVYDDVDFDGTPDGFPKSVRVDSAQHTGAIAPALSLTSQGGVYDQARDGWNLVGNPYGATVNWDAVAGWDTTGLDASFYVWSDSAGGGAGSYLSWNGALDTGTLSNGKIAPWQGFWVKANNGAAPSLSLNDSVRSAGGVFLKEKQVPQVKFVLEGSEQHSNAVVVLHPQAEAGKDPLDAWKLQSLSQQYLSLYTTTPEGQALDINALPVKIEQPLELNLNFEGSDLGGSYTLSWNPKDLPQAWPQGAVTLTDLYTDRIIDISEPGKYTFEVEAAKAKGSGVQPPPSKVGSEGVVLPTHGPIPTVLKAKATNPRFLLTINPGSGRHQLAGIPESIELAQNYPNPFNPATVIRYGVPEQSTVQLTIFDILGRKVATLINEQRTPGRYQVSFNASRFASGLYIYRLKVGGNVLTRKMMLIK